MPTWETAADWDNFQSEEGVRHETAAGTDFGPADQLEKGYPTRDQFGGSGLVAYFPLHEDSGSTANDLIGGYGDGAITDLALGETGILGNTAFDGNGSSSVVDIGDPGASAVTEGTNWSLSYWAQSQDTSLGDTVSEGNPPDWSDNLFISYYNDTFLTDTEGMRYYYSTLNDGFSESGTIVVGDPSFHHVVHTRESNTYSLYVDGNLDFSKTGPTDTLKVTSASLFAGNDDGNFIKHFDGRVTEVRYYDRTLSGAEVTSLYETGV